MRLFNSPSMPRTRVLNKFLYGAASPRGPTPYLFIYDFFFLRKRYPFHIPCLELCISLRSRYENATPNLCWVFCALMVVLCN